MEPKKGIQKIFFAILLIFVPCIVSAATPEYNADTDIFVAGGTPITIAQSNGKTLISWEGGSQEVKPTTTVIGGLFNNCDTATDACSSTLKSTSITMNSGEVYAIIGGSIVDKNYAKYSSVTVDDISVKINGGKVKEVSGVSAALAHPTEKKKNIINVALAASYYDQIKTFYNAKNVDITIKNANIEKRVYINSSYTSADKATITIDNSKVGENNSVGVITGTNGYVGEYNLNITDSNLLAISSGFRAMIDVMNVNVSGNSNVGDIFAGSYYPEGETKEEWIKGNWSIGDIDYGQIGKMTITMDENVKYNNIYAGFQYVDKQAFLERFNGNAALNNVAKGIANSEKAPLTINIKTVPSIINEKLTSMLNVKEDFVTINYTPKSTVEEIKPDEVVDEPVAGVVDKENTEKVLDETIKNDEKILQDKKVIEAIAEGKTIILNVETKKIEEPKNHEDFLKVKEGTQVAAYFDISVLIKTNDKVELGKVPELANKINLAVILPEKLQIIPEGFIREYFIIREHDGKIEKISAMINEEGKMITFETDKFSTYALAYVDTKVETPKDDEEIVDKEDEEEIKNPQTSDTITKTLMSGLLSITGLVTTVAYFKKRI